MNFKKFYFSGLSLLVFYLSSFATAAESSISNSDSFSTQTITHIEYNPFGLVKIEIPKNLPTPGDVLKSETHAPVQIQRIFYFIFPVKVEFFKVPPYEVRQVSLLKIPFMELVRYDEIFKKTQEPSFEEENPFRKTFQLDQPLFSLASLDIVTCQPRKTDEGNSYLDRIKRVKLLDSPVFTLVRYDEWGNDEWGKNPYYLELLDVPMVTTFAHKKGKESSDWKILKAPFIEVFTHYRYKNDIRTKLLRFPGGSIYVHIGSEKKDEKVFLNALVATVYWKATSQKKGDRWSILDMLVITGVKSRKNEKKCSLGILETPKIFADWTICALWRKEKLADGTSCQQYGRLPFIGPIWSSWKEPEDSKQRNAVFPRLFFGKYPSVAK